MSNNDNDINALLERIGRYDMFGFKGHGDMLYGLAFALEYLDAQPHSMQRARARASVADMKDLVIPIGKTLSDAGRALTALVAERDALKQRVEELEPDFRVAALLLREEREELRAELAAAIKQRDEARELYCVEAAHRSVCLRSVIDARTIARVRGWDCFKEWGGA
jgi:hypothetical protein